MTSLMRNWKVRLLTDGENKDGINVCGFRLACTRYERCDTAHIRVVVKDQTKVRALIASRSGFNRPDIVLQVMDARERDRAWRTVFHGVLDAVTKGADPSVFGFECRDYLAFLLDTRMASFWANQTPLEIVQQAVRAAGLNFKSDLAQADVKMGAYCGQFWQLEHRRLSATTQNRYQTAFDLAFSLARDHGYECHADGKAVSLHAPLAVGAMGARVFPASGVNVRSFRHDLGLAKNVVVGVQSWDSRQRARSEVYFDGENFSSRPPEANSALYTFRVPGQRMDDIRRLAQCKYRRIVSHALEAQISLPAVEGLAPRHFMTLDEGLFDRARTLSVDSVEHYFDLSHGYRQDVTLRDRVF